MIAVDKDALGAALENVLDGLIGFKTLVDSAPEVTVPTALDWQPIHDACQRMVTPHPWWIDDVWRLALLVMDTMQANGGPPLTPEMVEWQTRVRSWLADGVEPVADALSLDSASAINCLNPVPNGAPAVAPIGAARLPGGYLHDPAVKFPRHYNT